MINKVIIHIGVHKTASTTIQNQLGLNKSLLKENGFLYPLFCVNNGIIYNHSVPFVSLFHGNPAEYMFNKIHKFDSKEKIDNLLLNYEKQLSEQIHQFPGETLLLSGEDISRFSEIELFEFKTYFDKIGITTKNLEIIMFCRQPVTRLKSSIDLRIRNNGSTIERELNTQQPDTYYRSIISRFSKVFGKNAIKVFRFEDAIGHNQGPTGFFLEKIGADPDLISHFKNDRYNPSSSYETVRIFSEIHEKLPCKEGLPYSYQGAIRELLWAMPGQKFVLPLSFQQAIWERTKQDVDWLCETFSLPNYTFEGEESPPISKRWSRETIQYLYKIIPDLPAPLVTIIVETILDELLTFYDSFNAQKRKELFEFIMRYSFFLKLQSKAAKFMYFTNKAGYYRGVYQMGQYYIQGLFTKIRLRAKQTFKYKVTEAKSS